MGNKKMESWEKLFRTNEQITHVAVTFSPMTFFPMWSISVFYLSENTHQWLPMLAFPKSMKAINKMFAKLAKGIHRNHLRIDANFKHQHAIDNPGIFFTIDFQPIGDDLFVIAQGDDYDTIYDALVEECKYWAQFWDNRSKRQGELVKEFMIADVDNPDFNWMASMEKIEQVLNIEYPMPYVTDKTEDG